jgi:hypothetical protein
MTITPGLLIHAPGLSEERREAIRREDERERLQAERDAELRAQVAAERAADLLFRGVQPHSVGHVMTLAAYGVSHRRRIRSESGPDPAEGSQARKVAGQS